MVAMNFSHQAETPRSAVTDPLCPTDPGKTLRARNARHRLLITDFVTDQRGFVVSDFDDLIARGVIVVDGGEIKGSTLGRDEGHGRAAHAADEVSRGA
jgi:hypothetical protein